MLWPNVLLNTLWAAAGAAFVESTSTVAGMTLWQIVQVLVLIGGLLATWVKLNLHVTNLRDAMEKMTSMHEENKDKLSAINTKVEVIHTMQLSEKQKLSDLEWYVRNNQERRNRPRD